MEITNQAIQIAQPRTEVRVTILNDVLSAPIGTTIEAVLNEAIRLELIVPSSELIAAICNGKLRELRYELKEDATLTPIFLSSSDGGRIYRRSLVLLMTTAMHELWGAEASVKYSVPDG